MAADQARLRIVAVAVSSTELLRTGSDLTRQLAGAARADLLIVCGGRGSGERLRARVGALGLAGLRLHRLGLRAPLGRHVEGDIVAALSELVGFDPEPGVYCLAPVPGAVDPAGPAVERAVRRIGCAYGIPLRRYTRSGPPTDREPALDESDHRSERVPAG